MDIPLSYLRPLATLLCLLPAFVSGGCATQSMVHAGRVPAVDIAPRAADAAIPIFLDIAAYSADEAPSDGKPPNRALTDQARTALLAVVDGTGLFAEIVDDPFHRTPDMRTLQVRVRDSRGRDGQSKGAGASAMASGMTFGLLPIVYSHGFEVQMEVRAPDGSRLGVPVQADDGFQVLTGMLLSTAYVRNDRSGEDFPLLEHIFRYCLARLDSSGALDAGASS